MVECTLLLHKAQVWFLAAKPTGSKSLGIIVPEYLLNSSGLHRQLHACVYSHTNTHT